MRSSSAASASTTSRNRLAVEDALVCEAAGYHKIHKRVLYHSKRLRCKDHQEVLERYERQQPLMDGSELQKYAFHIGSWIVKLPSEQMTRKYGHLSAVTLLLLYLETLKTDQANCQKAWCPQLMKLLSQIFLQIDSEEQQWRQLKEALVPILSDARPEPSSNPAEQLLMEHGDRKAVRQLTRAIQRWRNHLPETQAAYVSDLEEALLKVETPSRLREIFRNAVAALSHPRLLLNSSENLDLERSATGGDVQQRLRKLILTCLHKLDLQDPRLDLSLKLLKTRIQDFQDLVTQGLVASHRDWMRLAGICGMAPETDAAIASSGSRIRKRCEHGVRLDDCKICRPCPHGNSKWQCHQCKGCPHGKAKKYCPLCSGCPHGKLKHNCWQCKGCPHGRLKQNCRECAGCPHGKVPNRCKICKPCPHGLVKRVCGPCNTCPHDRHKLRCNMCKTARTKVSG